MNNGKSDCPNCGHVIPTNAQYCYSCGQKQDSKILSVRGFINNTLSTIFHYDSSVWQTFKYLFIPGKLTEDYITGKRKRYLNPVRLFVFLALIYFIVSAPQTFNIDNKANATLMSFTHKTANANLVIDKLGLNGRNTFPNDSARHLYYTMIETDLIDTLRESDTAKWQLDSVSLDLKFWPFEDLADISIDYRDVYFMSTDSIFQKYKVESLADRYALKQYIKITSGLNSYEDFLLSKLTWLFFLLIPFQGIFMKLFYWDRTYIEHVIFLLHLHSLCFLVLLIYSLIQYLLPVSLNFTNMTGLYTIIIIIGFGTYYYLATKRVYRDLHWLNSLKMVPLFVTYWIGFIISLLAILLISMLLF